MEFLINNPLANLDGTTYLLVYVCLIIAMLIIGSLGKRSLDLTASLPAIPTPTTPNPYEIAYFRGGKRSLARAVLFHLVNQGFLQVSQGQIKQGPTLPPELSPLEQSVYDYFANPVDSTDLANLSPLLKRIKPHTAQYKDILLKKELVSTSAMRQRAWGNVLVLALIIIAFGTYRWYTLIARDEGGLFPVLLVGLIGVAVVVYWCRMPRLSERGQIYLRQLQQAFASLKEGAESVALTLAVSLFGVDTLAGTPHESFQAMFKPDDPTPEAGAGFARLWQRLVSR